eukprot:1157079-Pelagomonas_calceolata.AAC.3
MSNAMTDNDRDVSLLARQVNDSYKRTPVRMVLVVQSKVLPSLLKPAGGPVLCLADAALARGSCLNSPGGHATKLCSVYFYVTTILRTKGEKSGHQFTIRAGTECLATRASITNTLGSGAAAFEIEDRRKEEEELDFNLTPEEMKE